MSKELEFSPPMSGSPPASLDPEIGLFVQRMAADAGNYPRRDTISIEAGRQVAEQVRQPWAQGGPEMAKIMHVSVATRHGPVRLRVYYPSQRRLPGALLYVHGGGYVLFSLDTHDRVMREYAQRAGMVVIGIDYTRAPEAKFPQPLEECIDVVLWLQAHAAELDVDAKQLFIGGDSAGGNLSLGTCLHFRDEGEAPLRGMVLNYGTFSTQFFRDSFVRYGAGEFGLSIHMMVWFYRNYLNGREDLSDPRVDLLRADLRDLPPTYMVITECDPLHDENMELAAKLQAAEVEVQYKIYPGTVHSFLEAVSVAGVAVQAFDDTAQWIARHTVPNMGLR